MPWEYREVTVPLGFSRTFTSTGPLTDRAEEERGKQEVRERYAAIVRAALQGLAAEGWRPDPPADFETMANAGRLKVSTAFQKETTRFTFGDIVALTITHTYEHVTLRLRRAEPPAGPPRPPLEGA